MIKLFTPRKIERILRELEPKAREIALRYKIPEAMILAMLEKEMREMDLLDLAADLAVRSALTPKKDSSVGYAQIFGYVAVKAADYALDRGLDTPEGLGFPADHRPDPADPADVRGLWQRMRRDPAENLRFAALNLISAGEEMNGHTDFTVYTPEETMRMFTRYNANTREITEYGRQCYELFRKYEAQL